MTDLREALESRIAMLEDESDELAASLARAEHTRDAYKEMLRLLDELESPDPSVGADLPVEIVSKEEPKPKKTPKKKRGRPRGSKNRTKSPGKKKSTLEDYKEAVKKFPSGDRGTTPEEAQRAVARFKPTPRTVEDYGGVKAGNPEDI